MVKALLAPLLCNLEAVVLYRDPQAFVPAGSSLALSLEGQLEPDTCRGLQAGTWSRRCARCCFAVLRQLFRTALHKYLCHLAFLGFVVGWTAGARCLW
jgi:hypothetical protein